MIPITITVITITIAIVNNNYKYTSPLAIMITVTIIKLKMIANVNAICTDHYNDSCIDNNMIIITILITHDINDN